MHTNKNDIGLFTIFIPFTFGILAISAFFTSMMIMDSKSNYNHSIESTCKHGDNYILIDDNVSVKYNGSVNNKKEC